MEIDSTGIKEKQPIKIFIFPFPKTKKVELFTIIRTQDPITKENLSKTTSIRNEFLSSLEGNNCNQILNTCERYLPFLFGFVVSVEDNKNIRLNSPLNFSWSSTFSNKNKPVYYTSYSFKFEIFMTLITYAYAHINKSQEIIAIQTEENINSFEETSKKAVQYLKTAGGIFDYLITRELPRWPDIPKEKPLELDVNVLQQLKNYCILSSQMISIKKGLLGGTGKSVLAKLAIDVWNKAEDFYKFFKGLPEYKDLYSPFKIYIKILASLMKAIAFKYMGQVAYSEEKYGNAVAYLNIATESLKNISISNESTLLSIYNKEIEESKEHIEHLQRKYVMENNHIYFQQVSPEKIETMEPKCIINIQIWIPPQPSYTKIHP